MLKLLRKKGVAKKIIWFIAVIIIISFGFFGTAYLLTDTGQVNYAGKVFGKKIEIDEYNTMFNHVRIQAILKYGDRYKEVQQFLNFDQETWDRIILLHEADKQKIKVKNEEVVQAIEAIPLFQRNGQFDSFLYKDIIQYVFRNFGVLVEPREFEESMRDTLKFAKLFEQATEQAMINEAEIYDEFKNRNEKVQISYLMFNPLQYTNDVVYDQSKAKAFFEEDKLSFTLPPSINVEYIDFIFPEETTKPDDDLSENEILALEEKKDELRAQAENIFEELIINPDLAALKDNYDIEIKQTGLFSIEQPLLTLGWSFDVFTQLFTLPLNEITGPHETNEKITIMKIIDKKDSIVPTFEEVEEKVKETFINNEAKVIAKDKAKEYLQLILQNYNKSESKNFDDIVGQFDLKAVKTPLFKRGQYLPKIGISKEFEDAAFSLNNNNKISSVVDTESGTAILHLDITEEASREEFAQERDEIKSMLLTEKRAELFSEYLTQLRIEAKLENNIAKLREQQQQQ